MSTTRYLIQHYRWDTHTSRHRCDYMWERCVQTHKHIRWKFTHTNTHHYHTAYSEYNIGLIVNTICALLVNPLNNKNRTIFIKLPLFAVWGKCSRLIEYELLSNGVCVRTADVSTFEIMERHKQPDFYSQTTRAASIHFPIELILFYANSTNIWKMGVLNLNGMSLTWLCYRIQSFILFNFNNYIE